MNRSEFADFQRFLFARFPEIESWLAKVQQKAETIDAWYEVLRHADLHFAQEAVQRLHGKREPMPSWSFLPATIREIAARLKADAQRPTGGAEVFEVQQQRIQGAASYVKPESVEAVWARISREEAAKAAGGD